MKSKKHIILAVVIFFAGAGIGWLLGIKYYNQSTTLNHAMPMRLGRGNGQLANPLLACDASEPQPSAELNGLRQKISDMIGLKILENSAKRVSVYFRDLDASQWTGVNENDNYIPASLVKVPLLMAYYKLAEDEPDILNKKIPYDLKEDQDSIQEVTKPPTSLTRGKSYSVSELLFRMIAYSGNNSHIMLSQSLNPDFQEKIYNDLKVRYPDLSSATNESISPKAFATFFRVLYNASYLDDKMSEKALELLTETTFNQGLVAGVPDGVKVAHKFGERTITNNETGEVKMRELHDCGIIYKISHPYVLCVMTQGMDFVMLESVISDISKLVYAQ
jgi:beta-lactamase class A